MLIVGVVFAVIGLIFVIKLISKYNGKVTKEAVETNFGRLAIALLASFAAAYMYAPAIFGLVLLTSSSVLKAAVVGVVGWAATVALSKIAGYIKGKIMSGA